MKKTDRIYGELRNKILAHTGKFTSSDFGWNRQVTREMFKRLRNQNMIIMITKSSFTKPAVYKVV